MKQLVLALFISAILLPRALLADGTVVKNLPQACQAAGGTCDCPKEDGKKDDGTEGEQDANNGSDAEDGCIKVRLGLGRTTPWTGSLPCSLKIFADDDAPEIFTQESLHAVLGGYTFKRLGQRNMADGATPAEVVFSHPNGESVTFVFPEGESWGRPNPGVHRDMDERVMMADAEGWATAADPVYYDLYVGDGTRRRFLATDATGRRGALVSITDARGVVNTPEQMGVDIVYTPAGVRQFLTPSFLADVTPAPGWQGYDVAVYAPGDDLPAKDPATGLYALPAGNPVKRLSVRRENGGKRAVVTILRGGADPLVSVYDYAMGDWSLTRPSGVREEKERQVADSRAAQIVSTVRGPSGDRLSRRESNYRWMSWGFAMTNRVDGFGGVTETTSWTYHASGNGRGQVATERRQSGLLVQYTYDALDRIVAETRSGPGMMTQTTSYAYVSVDPADVVPPVDARPRTVVRTLDGIECERTYYAYTPLTNVVERVGEQGAVYGGTNALRTVTAYHPVAAGDIRSGFVQSIRHEDGKLDLYDYALASNLWTRTITHLHELSPEPVDGRTTRDIMVTNRRGETVETRTEALVEGAWHAIAREVRAFNAEGRIVRRENLAGQITTTVWDCCHKVSETQPDGSVTTWDYDEEGRMVASSKLIPLDMTNVTWLTTCHEYDGLGRQTATWQTNRIVGIGTPPERTLRDPLGRIALRTDARGAVTRFSYAETASGSMQTEIHAAGTDLASTNTVQFLPDGRVLSRSLNGDLRERHAYAPLSATTYSGPGVVGSPRWTRTDRDLLGRIVSIARPGFGGTTLVSSNRYDIASRLVETAENALAIPQGWNGQNATATLLSRTLLTYDLEGNEVLRVEDRDRNGAIDLAGADFAVSNAVSFVLHDDALWRRTGTYATVADGSPAFHFLGATETRLNGFSGIDDSEIGPASLVAETVSFDVHGNASTNRVVVRSDNALVLKESISPTSVQPDREVLHHGFPVSHVSSTAVTTSRAYDGLGRLSSVTDGRGNATLREYTPAGDLARIVDAAGNATEYAHDILGRRIAETDPLGHAVHRAYDAEGHVVGEWGATYPAAYEYDAWGRRTALYTYRGTNDIESAADLLALKPSMDRTRWLLDAATGFVTNKLYADGKGPTYTYTPDGKPLCRVWARGVATDYAYDESGALSSVAYSDHTPSVSYVRDRLGRVVRAVVEGVSTNEYAYSLSGLLTNEVQNGVVLSRSYDAFSRPTGYEVLGPETGNGEPETTQRHAVAYAYDTLGRFASVASGTNVFTYTRLPGTDLVTGYSCGPFRRAVTYEPQRDLITTVTNSFGDRLISAFDYVNDLAGRRISCRDTRENEVVENVFGYNLRSELTSAQMGTNSYEYVYDPIGNRIYSVENGVRTDYTANELNQYTEIQTSGVLKQLAYDEDGNTVSDGTGWIYAWNGENRMVLASNETKCVSYAYDERGRTVLKHYKQDNFQQNIHVNVWDGYNVIFERYLLITNSFTLKRVFGLDISGSLQTAGGVGALLNSFSEKGPVFVFVDSRGNVTDTTDCHGSIIHERAYAPYGQIMYEIDNSWDNGDVGYSTKYTSKTIDAIEFQFRLYSPSRGAWFSRDIEQNGAQNYYTFVDNNPINMYDILGNRAGFIQRLRCEGCPSSAPTLVAAYPRQNDFEIFTWIKWQIDIAGPVGPYPGMGDSSIIFYWYSQGWIYWGMVTEKDALKRFVAHGGKIPCRATFTCEVECQCQCEEKICSSWNTKTSLPPDENGFLGLDSLAGGVACVFPNKTYNRKMEQCQEKAGSICEL